VPVQGKQAISVTATDNDRGFVRTYEDERFKQDQNAFVLYTVVYDASDATARQPGQQESYSYVRRPNRPSSAKMTRLQRTNCMPCLRC